MSHLCKLTRLVGWHYKAYHAALHGEQRGVVIIQNRRIHGITTHAAP